MPPTVLSRPVVLASPVMQTRVTQVTLDGRTVFRITQYGFFLRDAATTEAVRELVGEEAFTTLTVL